MTNLDLLQTLTNNVCKAQGVDPDDIISCLILASIMNDEYHFIFIDNQIQETIECLKCHAPYVNIQSQEVCNAIIKGVRLRKNINKENNPIIIKDPGSRTWRKATDVDLTFKDYKI